MKGDIMPRIKAIAVLTGAMLAPMAVFTLAPAAVPQSASTATNVSPSVADAPLTGVQCVEKSVAWRREIVDVGATQAALAAMQTFNVECRGRHGIAVLP